MNPCEWLTILSTDLSLDSQEMVKIYRNRWSIEVFFKSIKSFMKLGTEIQGRSYDMMISHTPLVYCRYILLEWLKRQENNPKTFGELFLLNRQFERKQWGTHLNNESKLYRNKVRK